jgi:hypothetical protein
VRSVSASGQVTGPSGQAVGALVRRETIRSFGETVRVGYLLTGDPDGALAMNDTGQAFLVPPKAEPFSSTGGAQGDVARAKRTALVLYDAKLVFAEANP